MDKFSQHLNSDKLRKAACFMLSNIMYIYVILFIVIYLSLQILDIFRFFSPNKVFNVMWYKNQSKLLDIGKSKFYAASKQLHIHVFCSTTSSGNRCERQAKPSS